VNCFSYRLGCLEFYRNHRYVKTTPRIKIKAIKTSVWVQVRLAAARAASRHLHAAAAAAPETIGLVRATKRCKSKVGFGTAQTEKDP
jgi:hypothetical protein